MSGAQRVRPAELERGVCPVQLDRKDLQAKMADRANRDHADLPDLREKPASAEATDSRGARDSQVHRDRPVSAGLPESEDHPDSPDLLDRMETEEAQDHKVQVLLDENFGRY